MPEKVHKSSSKGQRRDQRLHHELLVAHRYSTVQGFITDWATNISKGGIFINTRKPQRVGSTIRLIISLPDAAFPFELTGRVTRVNEFDNPANEVPGMAVEFLDVDDEKRMRIERFVDRLRKELPDPPAELHARK
jgi:uncharacterized protein (TIGR02266 family)